MKHFSFAPYSPKLSSCSIRCKTFCNNYTFRLLAFFFPVIVNLNVGDGNLVK